MEQSVQQLIDEALADKTPRVRSGKYSPSSLGRCYRLQYWNRKDEPKSNPVDERTERVFKAGNLFHNFVQDLILKVKPDSQIELLIEDDNFKGFADMVINDEVVDIKSQHSRAFWYRDGKKWGDVESEIKHHILQVVWYAYKLGKPKARIIYVSKDDLCIQEYSFPVEKYIAEIEKEVVDLNLIWKEQKLPPPKPRAYGVDKKTGKAKDCAYCSWKDTCEKLEKK
jgi:hypothetical protein